MRRSAAPEGTSGNPATPLRSVRGLLKDRDLDPDPLQRDRGGEPADSAADDQRANGHLPASRPRVGCALPTAEPANSRLEVCSRKVKLPI